MRTTTRNKFIVIAAVLIIIGVIGSIVMGLVEGGNEPVKRERLITKEIEFSALVSNTEKPLPPDTGAVPEIADDGIPFADESARWDDWYRSTLGGGEQVVYDIIEQGVRKHEQNIAINRNMTEDVLVKCLKYVSYDNPDIFWIDIACKYTTRGGEVVDLIPTYTMTKEESDAKMAAMNPIIDMVVNAVPKTSQYETAKYFFQWVCDNTTYSYAASNHQEIDGVFLDKQAACAGYSRAFQILCQRAGIDCGYVIGDAGSSTQEYQSHAWNFARIDGTTCFSDVTWGDLDKEGRSADLMWFCLSAETIGITHAPKDAEVLPKGSTDALARWNVQQAFCSVFTPEDVNAKLCAAVATDHATTVFKFQTLEEMTAAADYILDGKTVTDIAMKYREKFPDMYEKSLYSVRRMPEMCALTVTWFSATARD